MLQLRQTLNRHPHCFLSSTIVGANFPNLQHIQHYGLDCARFWKIIAILKVDPKPYAHMLLLRWTPTAIQQVPLGQ
jgi:hypothetical protein